MMLTELFVQVAQMSLAAAIVGIPVGLLGAVFDLLPVPKRITCLLFLPVLLRMLCPVALPDSGFSLFHLDAVQSAMQSELRRFDAPVGGYEHHVEGTKEYDRAVAAGIVPERTDTGWNEVYYRQNGGELLPARRGIDVWVPWAARIWLAGMVLLWAFTLASYVRLRRKLRFAVKLRDNVYVSDRIPAPCLVGYLHPRIYLVPGLSEEEQAHIIAHEGAHLRWGDHWAKLIAWFAMTVHWFNLLLWPFYKIWCDTMEMACDEGAVREKNGPERAAYSQTLLDLAYDRRFRWMNPVAFSEGGTRARVKNVLRWKKPRPAVVVLAFASAAALFLICATGDGTEDDVLRVQVEKDTVSVAVADYTHRLTEEQAKAFAEVLGEGDWYIEGEVNQWLNCRIFSTVEIEDVSLEESRPGQQTYTISGWSTKGFGAWLPPDAAVEDERGVAVVGSTMGLWGTWTMLWDGERFIWVEPDITTKQMISQMIQDQLLMNLWHGANKARLSRLQCWQAAQYYGCEVYPMDGINGRQLIVEEDGTWQLLQTWSRKEVASGDFNSLRASGGMTPGTDLSDRTTWELVRALPACEGERMSWVLMQVLFREENNSDPLVVLRAATALGEEDRKTVCRLIANERWLVAQAVGPDMAALWVESMEELAQMDGVTPALQDTVKCVLREYEKFETGENTDVISGTGWVIAGPVESGIG